MAVEAPTYLGALQAFVPYEPAFVSLEGDTEGPAAASIASLATRAPGTRFAYLLPNFQNPTGGQISDARRDAIVSAVAVRVRRASATGIPSATVVARASMNARPPVSTEV
mgnify:CR=1 FL=1